MSEGDVHALRRIYSALSRWDIEELERDVTHDFELEIPEPLPWGGTHHGPDGVEAFANVFQDYVEGLWADPDDFLDADDRMVVLGRIRGRARKSDQDFEVPFAHVWGFDDGVAHSCRVYLDSMPIIAAIEGRE